MLAVRLAITKRTETAAVPFVTGGSLAKDHNSFR